MVANCDAPLTTDAMDGAASNGKLSSVKWLHSHRVEGCTTAAMDRAASRGRLDIVKWLHENRTEGSTTAAMDGAVANSFVKIGCMKIARKVALLQL